MPDGSRHIGSTQPLCSATEKLVSLKREDVPTIWKHRDSFLGWTKYMIVNSTLETPRTSGQFIAGAHRNTNNPSHSRTPTVNLEFPNQLACMFLDCVRKPEYPKRTDTDKGRTSKLHTGPLLEIKLRTFLLWGNSAQVPQCHCVTWRQLIVCIWPIKC